MRLLIGTILFVGAAFGQATVTLKGSPYTLKSHPRVLLDGPSGALTSSLAGKAVAGNVPWDAMSYLVTTWTASASGTQISTNTAGSFPKYQLIANRGFFEDGVGARTAALVCYAGTGSLQTSACTMAQWLVNHVESYMSVGACIESLAYCGVSQEMADVGSEWIAHWSQAYSLIRSSLSTSERQHFVDKMLNDRAEWGGIGGLDGYTAGAACVNGTSDTGVYISVTSSLNVASNTAIFGTTIHVGDWISSSTGGANGVYVRVLSITDSTHAVTDSNNTSTHASGIVGANPNLTADYSGTVSISGSVATIVSGSSSWGPGLTGNYLIIAGTAYQVLSNTTTTATLASAPGDSAGIAYKSGGHLLWKPEAWTADQCGVAWVIKHHEYSNWPISIDPASTQGSPTFLYPDTTTVPVLAARGADASVVDDEYAHNLTYTKAWGFLLLFLGVIDDDANAASRSQAQMTALYDHWQDYIWDYAKKHWNGMTQSGSYYQMARAWQMVPQTAVAVTNSLATAPPTNLVGGNWAKGIPAAYYMGQHPADTYQVMKWGQNSVAAAQLSPVFLIGMFVSQYMNNGTDEQKYGNWWMRNVWGVEPGNSASKGWTASNFCGSFGSLCSSVPSPRSIGSNEAFIFTSPTDASVALDSSAPMQYFFGAGDTGPGINILHSRTGFPSGNAATGDTLLSLFASWIGNIDHIGLGNPGSMKIVKRGYLLGEDPGFGNSSAGSAAYSDYGSNTNFIQVGGADNLKAPTIAAPMTPIMDKTKLDGSNRYVYAREDLSGAYTASAAISRIYRHVAHLKKPGAQDFVIVYDDVASTSGKTKREYWQYVNNGGASEGTTTLSTNSVSSNNASDVSPTAQLFSKILSPAGANTVAISGGAGANGTTYRVAACASTDGSTCDSTNTSAEFLTVHMAADGSGNSMPAASMLSTITSTFRGVQIDGSAPKIAIFPRAGTTYSSVTFTTTHSGAAQILVSGLTSGIASITKDGSPVTTMSVGSDNTVYFESTDGGSFSISTAPILTLSTGSISASCISGSAVPVTNTVSVDAAGTTLDNWSATKAQSWLSLSPSSGSAAGSFTASINCSALAPGSYTDTISVASTTAGITNSPQTVALSLTVSSPPPPVLFPLPNSFIR